MRRVVALSVALLLPLAGAAASRAQQADETDVVQRVAAATAAFRAATAVPSPEERAEAFRDAARLYRVALADGPRNGALECNAGNAWLLSGDVGRAILHYRRALELRPGDPRVEANLGTARTRRRDQFEATSARALTDTLLFWHHGLSLRSKLPVALGAWALGFALLAAGAWLPRGRVGRSGARRTGALLVVVSVALGGSVLVELRSRAARDAAVVVVDEIALRTGDGASYPERYEHPVHSGAEVHVVEERAGWVDVELPDGKRGWVPVDAVERV